MRDIPKQRIQDFYVVKSREFLDLRKERPQGLRMVSVHHIAMGWNTLCLCVNTCTTPARTIDALTAVMLDLVQDAVINMLSQRVFKLFSGHKMRPHMITQ